MSITLPRLSEDKELDIFCNRNVNAICKSSDLNVPYLINIYVTFYNSSTSIFFQECVPGIIIIVGLGHVVMGW